MYNIKWKKVSGVILQLSGQILCWHNSQYFQARSFRIARLSWINFSYSLFNKQLSKQWGFFSCMTPIKVNRSHVAKTLCNAWIYWKLASGAESTSIVWSSSQSSFSAWSCSLLHSYLLESPCLTFLFLPQYPFTLKIKEPPLRNHYCLHALLFGFSVCGCFVQPQLLLNFAVGCSESLHCSCNQLRLHNTLGSGWMKVLCKHKLGSLPFYSEMLGVKIPSSGSDVIALLKTSF